METEGSVPRLHQLFLDQVPNQWNIVHITLTRFYLTHCGRVTQICVFNTVKLGTSASSP